MNQQAMKRLNSLSLWSVTLLGVAGFALALTNVLPSTAFAAKVVSDEPKPDGEKDEPKPVPPLPEPDPGKRPDEGGEADPIKRAEELKKTRDAARKNRANKPMADKPGGAPNKPATARPEIPMATGAEATPAGAGETGPSIEINIPPADPSQSLIPPEERQYSFSLKDVTYEQLLEAVGRYTGLAVMGDAPKDGKTSFVTDQVVGFKEMLSRVKMLLFNYKTHEPYWIEYRTSHLEVMRVNDVYRMLPQSQMFQNIEQYRAAKFPMDELALVVFTPKSGSIADLREVRNFLPDYFRVTPQEGRNSLILFGLVRDIEKYLDLADFFAGGRVEPRVFKTYKIEHVSATDAANKLQTMMELDKQPRTAGTPTPRAGGRGAEPNPLENIQEPEVLLLPDDALRRILVRAMQDKIEQIEFYLPIIDVAPQEAGYPPVIIEVKYADCVELTSTIQQILTASPEAGAAISPAAPKGTKKKGKAAAGAAPQPSSPPAVPVKLDEITMIPQPSRNSIIVLADPEGVEHVRNLVAMFDVEHEKGPIQIPVRHLAASEVATSIMNVLGGDAAQPNATPFHMVSDRTEDKIWFTGSEKDLARVRDLVASFDQPEPEAAVRIVVLQYQKPSFVANMLRALENSESQPAPQQTPPTVTAQKKSGKKLKAVRANDPSKFTAEDETNRLYLLCTEDEWAHYSKVIADLESAAKSQEPVFVKLPLKHLTATQAIDQLNPLVSASDGSSHIKYSPAEGGLMVIGATPVQVAEMKTILGELDKPMSIVERTFEIRHADPADVESLLTTLLGDPNSPKEARPKVRKSQKSDENAPVIIEATTGEAQGLTLARLGNRIVVRTSPELMERVAELIAQFDVETGATQVRTYADFAPTADLDDIAATLSSVFSGSPAPGTKPGKKPRVESGDGARFIPQQAAGKLVVIAETELFPRIEELIEILRAGGLDSEPIVTRTIDLKHREASEVVEALEPLLNLKVRQLEVGGKLSDANGEAALGEPKGKKKSKPTVGRADHERYHLGADDRARRVIIAAPQAIIDEAVLLIAELDSPTLGTEPVFRTVPLRNAEAADMVMVVRDLMGGSSTGKVPKKGSKKDPIATTIDVSDTPLMITEVPGGKAVVLNGAKKDVDQAVRWIENLDLQSIPGRLIKVYDVQHADIERLANLIMAVADIPDKPAAPKPKSKSKAGDTEEEDSEDEEFKVVHEHVGSEVYIQTDTISKTMIVAASQAKFAQIDPIVERFNKGPDENGEKGMTAAVSVPKFIYELKHKDPFDAVWDLETLLEGVWEPPGELPKVKEAGFGQSIIVRFPDESRFDEIKKLIAENIDKPKKPGKIIRRPFVPPGEMSPKDAAHWLKVHYPNLEIEIEMPEDKPKNDFGIEQIKPVKQASASPCVLPTAFARAAGIGLTAAVLMQPQEEPEQPQEEDAGDLQHQMMLQAAAALRMQQEQAGKSAPASDKESGDTTAKKSKSPISGKVKIVVDPDKGVFIVEAPEEVIEDIDDGMDDLGKEIEDLPEKPDIRIYRVRYIDVDSAKDILEEMFGTPRAAQQAQLQQQAMMARMQQQQAAAAARGAAQNANQNAQGKEGAQPGTPPGRGQPPQNPLANLAGLMPPSSPNSLRVVANARDRTLILRANTSQYPEILELLATIDQPKPIDSELRVFALDKLNAVEIEGVLKEMLGLDQPTGGTRRRGAVPGVPGGAGATMGEPAGGSLPRRIEAAPVTGTLPLTVDPKDIRITSNEDTNSILVMAPREAIDYIGNLIKQLENQDLPERITKHYALIHADVLEVSEYLTNQFAEAKSVVRGGRNKKRPANAEAAVQAAVSGGGSINAPTFVAYTRLDLLSVQATADQIKEVDELIAILDVRAPIEELQSIELAHADAKSVADTLTAMFGGASSGAGAAERRAGKSGGSGPKFIGEEGARILFFSAPRQLYQPIQDAVAKLEEQYRGTSTVRVIELLHALPSDVADAIDGAYGSGRRAGGAKGGKGGASSSAGARFSVTANDATKRLFVVADDEMFGKVESLAKSLDLPRQIGFEMKIFPLKYANARGVHTQMTKLVTDYMRMLGPANKTMEPFSVDVDDRANALIVVGGPVVFGFVESAMQKVDVPGNANPVGFFMTVLKNGDAQEVAGNITRLWAQKAAGQGEAAPQVEANRATNAIIVRGTQSQLEEIKKQVIEPLEQQAQPFKTEIFTLVNANPEVVGDVVKKIFDDRKLAMTGAGKNIAPAELTVAVTADVNTNQVIVQASETNMAIIKERIAQLDRPEVVGGSVTTTKTYTIKLADANTVANIITQWARGRTTTGPGGKIAPRDQVTALPEPSTQSVVVTANEANHKLIADMIKDVDSDRGGLQQTHVVTLKNTEAESVSRTLNEIFVRSNTRPAGSQGPPISISAVPGTKALLVKSKAEDFARIQDVVNELDSETASAGEEVRVVPVLYGDATEMKTALQEYLKPPGQQSGTTKLVGDVRISVLAQGNAVVISGDKPEVDRLEATVKRLDSATEKGSVPQIIPLKFARASQLLPSIQEVFENPQGGARRNQPAPVIVADEILNALVVKASTTDFTAIKGMVDQLDTEIQKNRPSMRIVQVQPGMNLTQLAETVEEAVNESAKAQAPAAGRGSRQVPSITIMPNAQTRTLLVSGTPSLFDQVEEIVRAYEGMGPATGEPSTVIFRTTNLTADDVQAVIDQLTEAGVSGGRQGRRSGTGGGAATRPSARPQPRRSGP